MIGLLGLQCDRCDLLRNILIMNEVLLLYLSTK